MHAGIRAGGATTAAPAMARAILEGLKPCTAGKLVRFQPHFDICKYLQFVLSPIKRNKTRNKCDKENYCILIYSSKKLFCLPWVAAIVVLAYYGYFALQQNILQVAKVINLKYQKQACLINLHCILIYSSTD